MEKKSKTQKKKNKTTTKESEHAFRKNWEAECMCCEQTPTVGDTDLCGPCCFGEAETLGGNW